MDTNAVAAGVSPALPFVPQSRTLSGLPLQTITVAAATFTFYLADPLGSIDLNRPGGSGQPPLPEIRRGKFLFSGESKHPPTPGYGVAGEWTRTERTG
jgi:hypothetical protein